MVAPPDVQEAFREGAVALERPEVRTLEVSGPDRVRYLNGMLSADVAALAEGQGAMAVKLTNKGRVEGVLRVRALKNTVELDLHESAAERVLKSLASFIIMDDCAIADVSARREVVSIYGPEARRMVGLKDDLRPHDFITRDGPEVVIREATMGLEGYELHVPLGNGIKVIEAFLKHGAKRGSWPDLDVARVEAGMPLDGRDIDEDTIPMEARLDPALNMTKGCYIGQEVISRATNLGGIKHILVGLILQGAEPPAEGTPLYSGPGGPRTGEITSVVYSPYMGSHIGLGYVHKKDEAPGLELIAKSDVTRLPFVKTTS
jgi:folate-binding protein YgfZ